MVYINYYLFNDIFILLLLFTYYYEPCSCVESKPMSREERQDLKYVFVYIFMLYIHIIMGDLQGRSEGYVLPCL